MISIKTLIEPEHHEFYQKIEQLIISAIIKKKVTDLFKSVFHDIMKLWMYVFQYFRCISQLYEMVKRVIKICEAGLSFFTII